MGSITAIISSGDQIVARQPLETRLRITSRGAKARNVNATSTGSSSGSARSSEDLIIQGVLHLPFHTFRLLIRAMHRSYGSGPGVWYYLQPRSFDECTRAYSLSFRSTPEPFQSPPQFSPNQQSDSCPASGVAFSFEYYNC